MTNIQETGAYGNKSHFLADHKKYKWGHVYFSNNFLSLLSSQTYQTNHILSSFMPLHVLFPPAELSSYYLCLMNSYSFWKTQLRCSLLKDTELLYSFFRPSYSLFTFPEYSICSLSSAITLMHCMFIFYPSFYLNDKFHETKTYSTLYLQYPGHCMATRNN